MEDAKMPAFLKTSAITVNQTYSYINNTGFYALANPIYFNFYYRFARRYAWWYDGWVPDFHNAEQGIFSTNLAHALVDGIANQIVGKKILLQSSGKSDDKKNSDNAVKKAYKWAGNIDLTKVVRTSTKYAGALSTSLIKANIGANDIWLETLRFDNFFFECNFKGDLENVTCLINSYTDTNANRDTDWIDKDGNELQQRLNDKFFLVEKRYFKEIEENVNGEWKRHKVPFVVYQVHKYNGNILNSQSWNLSLQENYSINSIPTNVLKSIKRDYSVVKLGEPQRLPFNEHLGCELVLYNDCDGSLAQQPFGESILKTIISDLMEYDLAVSYSVRDMYQGKGTIFMAKELQTITAGTNAYSGMEDSLITKVPTIDGKLPIDQVQFALRVEEWRAKINSIYERIATKLGISPSSIASYLTDNTARTAKEVSTESSATDNYIDIQRSSIARAFNKLLKVIGLYYAWEDEIEIRFSKGGTQNLDTIIDRVIKLKSAGLIHPREALRQLMVDADEYEVEQAYESLEAYNNEQSKLEQARQDSMFGSLDIGGSVYGNTNTNT